MTKRALIVGPAWIGDLMMSHTLIRELSERQGIEAIDVIAPPWSHPLLHRMPGVRKALELNIAHGELGLGKRRAFGKSLNGQYDIAYVCPNSFKSALVPWWAGIPERHGWLGEQRYLLLNHILKKPKQFERLVDRYQALALGRTDGKRPPALQPRLVCDDSTVEALFTKQKLSRDRPILALCPGAAFGNSKQWPIDRYARVAEAYLTRGWHVMVFGSKNEAEQGEAIRKATGGRAISLCGQLTLAESVDVMSRTDMVLTNDSGLMHMAAALGKPLVAIYGSSDPRYTPPLSSTAKILRHPLPCSPCFERTCPLGHHDCMKSISVAQVMDALLALEQTEAACAF